MTKGFLDWLESKADAFSNFLDGKKGTKELDTFFTNAKTVMGQFGSIFGNIFKGIGAIIVANFGPGTGGDTMLKWLQTATQGFADMGKGKGASELQGWFKGAADNAISMFKVIGKVFKIFLDLADAPQIKKFWDTLGTATPAIEKIVTAGMEAAPIMGELFVNVANIMAAFADSKTPQVFFGILNTVAKAVSDFFNSKFMQSILSVTGPIHGVFLALGTLAIGFKLVALYVAYLGFKAKMIWDVFKTVFSWLWKGIMRLGQMFMWVGRMISLAFAANPIGVIIAAIAIVVAALVWFFTQTKVGKEMWANFMKFLSEAWSNIVKFFKDVFDGFAKWFAGIWDSIKGFVQPVIDFIGGLFKFYIDMWVGIFTFFFNFFKGIWNAIVAVVKFAVDIIVAVFKVVWDVISVIVGVIVGIFKIAFAVIAIVVSAVWLGIQAGFKAVADFLKPILDAIFGFFSTVFTNIGNFVKSVWDGLVAAFQVVADFIKPILDSIFGFFRTVFTNIGNFFKGVWDGIIKAVKFIGGVFENVWNGIVSFFKGAINSLIGMAEGFVNFFINGLNYIISMINKIKFKVPDWVIGIGGQEIGFNLKPVAAFKLPRLADGGVVMPSRGGSIVNVAEAGRAERIEPLDSNGLSVRDRALIEMMVNKNAPAVSGSPISISVVATPEMDKSELAAEIGRVLQLQMRRGARA
jgi:phage-related protein